MATVTYEWKIRASKALEANVTLLQLAHDTVLQVEPNAKRFSSGGVVVPDLKHITVSYKTEELESRGLHQTLHGYVQADGSVVAIAGKRVSSDNFCPFPSKPLWPTGLDGELVIGRAATPQPEETAVSCPINRN